MSSRFGSLVVLMVCVGCVEAVSAHSVDRTYLSAAGGVAVQPIPGWTEDGPYFHGGLGGTRFLPSIGGGVPLGSNVGLQIEFAWSRLEGTQSLPERGWYPGDPYAKTRQYNTVYNERWLTAVGQIGRMGVVRPVAGVTLAFDVAHRTKSDSAASAPQYPSEETNVAVGIVGGVDLVVPAARNVDVVPFCRVHYVFRESDPTTARWGVGPWIVQAGMGIRLHR